MQFQYQAVPGETILAIKVHSQFWSDHTWVIMIFRPVSDILGTTWLKHSNTVLVCKFSQVSYPLPKSYETVMKITIKSCKLAIQQDSYLKIFGCVIQVGVNMVCGSGLILFLIVFPGINLCPLNSYLLLQFLSPYQIKANCQEDLSIVLVQTQLK